MDINTIDTLERAAQNLIHIARQLQPQVNITDNTDASFTENCYKKVKSTLPGIEKFVNLQNIQSND